MRKKRPVPLKSTPTFAFVVDGECEVWYLQMLKRHERSLRVKIEPQIPQRKSLEDQFEKVSELSEDYTKVFWIIDFDDILRESRQTKKGDTSSFEKFIQYRKKIKRNFTNVYIIINNPCLEFWFLIHFEITSKYFKTCKAAEKQLKSHLKGYEKTKKFFTKQDNDIYLKLKPNLKKAVLNAKKIRIFSEDSPDKSISEMHILFNQKEFKQLIEI